MSGGWVSGGTISPLLPLFEQRLEGDQTFRHIRVHACLPVCSASLHVWFIWPHRRFWWDKVILLVTDSFRAYHHISYVGILLRAGGMCCSRSRHPMTSKLCLVTRPMHRVCARIVLLNYIVCMPYNVASCCVIISASNERTDVPTIRAGHQGTNNTQVTI